MSKKWYNFFVSVEPSREEVPEREDAAPTVAQTVADIAALMDPPDPAALAQRPLTACAFSEIYEAAGIRPPAHGYTILTIASMLESEQIAKLPPEAKRSSVVLAVQSAGAAVQDIVRDAISRDRALDASELLQEQALASLELSKTKDNERLQAELSRLVAEYRARMQANTGEVERARERFSGWRAKKQEEEQKIAHAVSYFVTENPITIRPAAPGGKSTRSAAPAPFAATPPSPAETAGD